MNKVKHLSILAGLSTLAITGLGTFLAIRPDLKNSLQISKFSPQEFFKKLAPADAEVDPKSTPKKRSANTQISQSPPAPASPKVKERYRGAVAQLNSNPRQAIEGLSGLETEYPLLAPYIWLKQAQAYTLIGDRSSAASTYQQILQEYPQSAVAAEALFALGQTQTLIQKFPSHPRALTAILSELKRMPDRVELLTTAAVYFQDRKEVLPLLDRLVAKYPSQINPAQWWAIAEGYFDQREFLKAANAYSWATPNSFTAYRQGRSWQRAGKKPQALAAYLSMARSYPNSPAAPRALLRAIKVAEPNQGVALADRVVNNYPAMAAEALLSKYDLALKLDSKEVAASVRRTLISQYPTSEFTATLTWRLAQQQAKSSNLREAVRLAKSVVSDLPHSEIEAEAIYWAGKWSNRLGDRSTATKLFQQVLKDNPASYYAWRSAVQLGWQVGDFNNVRSLSFDLRAAGQRQALPAGSSLVQELYLGYQDRDAATQWQYETRGKLPLNVKEVLTDGVLRVGVNDNIIGIYQLDSLNWLDVSASDKLEIKKLQQHPAYYQNLYPFAYGEAIARWSKQMNLNPALVTGLIRQESRFESEILSVVGATGLMQIMPETGAWIAGKKKRANYSLRNPEDNIEFGTFYLDYTHSRFNNNSMLAVASYNAGPGAVSGWTTSGIGDPDDFVQKIPYAETRGYVKHVFENYWNYLRLYSPEIQAKLTTTN
jgi:soluble lytic murein transglycosylase